VVSGASGPPAVFLATDLLNLDGETLAGQPLHVRLDALHEVISADSRIQAPDHVAGHGRALATAAAQRGLAALIARRRHAPYRAGIASPDRLRIALSGRRDAVVLGWRRTGDGVCVVLGDWVDGRLGLVGTAAVEPATAAHWLASAVDVADSPLVDEEVGPGVTWVRPRLVATVDPASEDAASASRWRLVALRDDVDPAWCVRRHPVPPPEASAHQPLRPFSPTVLSALPLG
jgi:bifunctional non-homologous end joining protein LigD